MALITDFTCSDCDKEKYEVVDGSGVCQDCRWKKATKAKRRFLSGLKGLSLEERLERIEELLYDNPPHKHTNIQY